MFLVEFDEQRDCSLKKIGHKLTFLSISGPCCMAYMMALDNVLSRLRMTVSMPVSCDVTNAFNFGMASVKLFQSLLSVPK